MRAITLLRTPEYAWQSFDFAGYAEELLQKEIVRTQLPGLLYVLEEEAIKQQYEANEEAVFSALWNRIVNVTPVLAYVEDEGRYETQIEDDHAYEAILRNEGADEEHKDVEDAPVTIPNIYITDKALLENEGARTQKVQYEMSDLEDFEYLLNNFYTVDKTTTIGNKQLSAKAMLEKDYSIKKDEKKILIYHTHSQEGYVDSVEGDLSTTVVGVGERLTELLEGYGYQVIHHKGQYDVTSRDYAYTNAAPAIEKLLSENPDIEIIIDLHRDGVAEDRHLVTEIDGKPMAQFMFLNGLSFTTTYGNIEYLPNPYIANNLGFAFQLQLKSAEYYPSLARKVYLKGYRYNMHYMPRSLLVEVGAQTNTLEEAMNTMEPLAHILDMILSEESVK